MPRASLLIHATLNRVYSCFRATAAVAAVAVAATGGNAALSPARGSPVDDDEDDGDDNDDSVKADVLAAAVPVAAAGAAAAAASLSPVDAAAAAAPVPALAELDAPGATRGEVVMPPVSRRRRAETAALSRLLMLLPLLLAPAEPLDVAPLATAALLAVAPEPAANPDPDPALPNLALALEHVEEGILGRVRVAHRVLDVLHIFNAAKVEVDARLRRGHAQLGLELQVRGD